MAEKIFPEKYLEALKKLRLIDDAFFSAFFDDNAEDVEYILRIILDKSDLKVLKVQTREQFRLVRDIIRQCWIITT